MKTHILAAATMVGFLALSSAVFAANNDGFQSATSTTVAQTTIQDAEKACTAAKDPPRPLGIVLKGISIIPTTAPNYIYGGNMVGSCVGTAQYVQNTAPFRGANPFPASWWQYNPYPLPLWYGTL
jgi:hypothetical protein